MRLKQILTLIFFLWLTSSLLSVAFAQGQETPLNQPTASPSQTNPSGVDYTTVCLAIAAMSAEVGGIVVVFIAFAVQELRHIGGQQQDQSELYKSIHNRSKLSMLLVNAAFSMAAFLLGAIITVFNLLELRYSQKGLAVLSLAFFSYGTFSMLISVMAYLILERPFWRVSLGSR